MDNENIWDNKTLKDNFFGVIRDCKILKKESLEKKYSKFSEKFPKSYGMAIDSVINNNVQETIKKFEDMLNTIKIVQNGNMTPEVANLKTGNDLGKIYIYPVIGKTPTEDEYKIAIDKINETINETTPVD